MANPKGLSELVGIGVRASRQVNLPTFPTDSWVRLLYDGPRVGGIVASDVSMGDGTRFVTFTDPETLVEYTVPPSLLERVLSPSLEDLVVIILGEHLNETDLTITDARDIITRIARHIEEEHERAAINEARNA